MSGADRALSRDAVAQAHRQQRQRVLRSNLLRLKPANLLESFRLSRAFFGRRINVDRSNDRWQRKPRPQCIPSRDLCHSSPLEISCRLAHASRQCPRISKTLAGLPNECPVPNGRWSNQLAAKRSKCAASSLARYKRRCYIAAALADLAN